jgi:hypothetical protein
MRTILQGLATLVALGLVGCAVTSNPEAYDVEGVQGAQLRAPQRVALKNSYMVATVVPLARGFEVDAQQVTETAISMLRRAVEKQGITLAPEAEKTLVLRVQNVSAGQQNFMSPMTKAGLALDVAYGDGTTSTVLGGNVGYGHQKAIDGAVLFALNKLMQDGAFLAYMNK